MTPSRIVAVGRIGRAFGVRGWLHITSDTDPPEALAELPVWLIEREGKWEPLQTAKRELRPNGLVAKLKGVDDRESARLLTGSTLGVAREALPSLDDDEFYWVDLIGAEVVDMGGTVLGRLERFLETGANDVMVVVDTTTSRHETLIPFVFDDVVNSVDIGAGRITVRWEPIDGDEPDSLGH
ncbi:MAG: ribosome maturation factor RimM [Gammaproteobacteria bacterium]|nr:ribosome maturation factor RimM [Gammaproteobacteria bacterium]